MSIHIINECGEEVGLTYDSYEKYAASLPAHKEIIQTLAHFAKEVMQVHPSSVFSREMLNLALDLYHDQHYHAGDDFAPLRLCANYALIYIYREIEKTGTFVLEEDHGSTSH